ncbi:MAG: transporter [Rhodocyclales bacterium GT-UBC]|nr:MAG: transporter [Rhodocyclales bacterium GT-UBC]
MKKMTLRTIPAVLLLAFSGVASAAAFQLWEQNASGLGNAYAGSAAIADNASTIFFNPAGMTQMTGLQLSAGAVGVGAYYEFRNSGSTVSGNDGGNAGGWAAVPNGYFSAQLTNDLFLGFGVSVPFGLATEYNDSNWVGRFQSLKSEIRTVNYNPSVAYRINDKISLGLGINYQTINAEMTNMTPVGLYRVKGDDSTWGWNAGALFTLSPAMRVGVSYRSTMDYTLDGTRSVAGVSRPATASIKLPDTFILSVWQQVSDRWEAMGDLSYTNWSTVDKLNIRTSAGTDVETFGYKDSWRIAWGAAYKATDAMKLKFGLAYDRTPVTNTDRSARVPDNDRLWFSLGGQWNAGRYGKFDLGYSYLYVKDPSISQSKLGTTLRGQYDDSAHLIGVQYSVGF